MGIFEGEKELGRRCRGLEDRLLDGRQYGVRGGTSRKPAGGGSWCKPDGGVDNSGPCRGERRLKNELNRRRRFGGGRTVDGAGAGKARVST